KLDAVALRLSNLEDSLTKARKSHTDAEAAICTVEDNYKKSLTEFGKCDPPSFAKEHEPQESIPDDFDDAVSLYQKQQATLKNAAVDITNQIRLLEGVLGSDYSGADEHETIRLLREELEALTEQEDALRRD